MKKTLAVFAAVLLLPGSALSAISEADRSAAITETDRALRSTDADMKDFFREKSGSEPVSGKRWLGMPAEERERAVIHSMSDLSERGVVFGRRPEEYAVEIGQILNTNPSRQSERLTNLLAAVIYETEPESRAALEAFRTDAR